MSRWIGSLVVALAVVICLSPTVNAQKAGGKWTKCKTGKYQAHQIGKLVVVVGYGHHNSGGYKVKFRLLPIDIDPPEYELLHQKPGGFAIQAITPFATLTHFKAARRLKTIIVHDANGRHKVAVKQAGKESNGRLQAHALLDRLLDANTTDVPTIVKDMSPYRRWLDPLLRNAYKKAEANNESRKQLHASLALLPVDSTQVNYLYGRLLATEPNEVPVIRDALFPHKHQLLDKLWGVVEKPEKSKEQQRLRAAATLAKYVPGSEKWEKEAIA